MLEPFDQIRIINLPYRTDRRADMLRELARIGLADDPRVSFFEAIRPADQGDFYSVGARGVYLSHLQILREAADAGMNVLILEDDCQFTPAALSAGNLPDPATPWDIFYGGYEATDPGDLYTSDIVGAHMMGFTANTARRLCDYLDNLVYDGAHPPIDGAYVWFRRANDDIRTAFAVPPLAVQRSSRSDVGNLRLHDRITMLRPFLAFARRIKRGR